MKLRLNKTEHVLVEREADLIKESNTMNTLRNDLQSSMQKSNRLVIVLIIHLIVSNIILGIYIYSIS